MLGTTNLARHGILSVVFDEVLVGFRVVLPVLLHDVLTNVAMRFLHLSCDLQLVLRRDGRHLPSFSHQVQHKLTDVPPGDGNVFDRTADDVPLSTRDNVGDTIARVNNGPGKCTVRNLVRGPGSGECKYRLYGDVKTLDVERLEKDLRSLFSVLWRVERRFGLRRVGEVSRFLIRRNLWYTPARNSDPLAPPSDT